MSSSSLNQLNWESIKAVFHDLSVYGVIKLFIGLAVTAAQWVYGAHVNLVLVVLALVLLDTATGVWKSAKAGMLSSKGFFKFAAKIVVYLILLATGSLVDQVLPIRIGASIMGSFLAMTEAISVLENVAIIGFPVPNRLLKFLKDYNERVVVKNG